MDFDCDHDQEDDGHDGHGWRQSTPTSPASATT